MARQDYVTILSKRRYPFNVAELSSIKPVVTIPANTLRQTQLFEFAAWSEEWILDAGRYELTPFLGGYGKNKIMFTAEIPCTLESDYFASHFGGNAIGQYDSTKNAGKKSTRSITFSYSDIFNHQAIEITSDYCEALEEYHDYLVSIIETGIAWQVKNWNDWAQQGLYEFAGQSTTTCDEIKQAMDSLQSVKDSLKKTQYAQKNGYPVTDYHFIRRNAQFNDKNYNFKHF